LQFVIRLIEMEDKQEESNLLHKLEKLNEELDHIVNNGNSQPNVLLHTIE
jgi:hypothetical protein